MPTDLNAYAAVLLDLDGTVYHEDHALPGAVELLLRLRRQGRPFACLSNSTTSPARIARRLARMGVEGIDEGHIHSAAAAACEHVLERLGDRPRVFNLATEGVHELLDGKVDWVDSGDGACDAIIAGAPANFYATDERQRTALALLRRGVALVGICADRVYPSPRGIEFGCGALCSYLGYAAHVTPTYCGKPHAPFFLGLCRKLGVDPRACVLIGDNLESDIAGAKGVGMKSILVLGGVASAADAAGAPAPRRPAAVVGGRGEL